MNKMFAVLKREYLQTVRKPMFKIMTLAMPLLMVALFYLPQLMIAKGMGTKRIAVLDATGQLRDTFTKADEPEEKPAGLRRRDIPGSMNLQYVDATHEADLEAAAKPFLKRMNTDDKEQRIDGVLLVPKDAVSNTDAHLKYYTRTATDFITEQRLGGQAGRGIHRLRLAGRGLSAADLDKLLSDVSVDGVQLSKTGEQKKGGTQNFIIGFILTALVILPAFVYGLEIMRGIIQEKTDRVVEVLVSSMSASQLLVGKILGVAAVGLTQVTVWILMGAGAAAYFGAGMALAGENVFALLRPATFGYFGIFFILAYLTYVCVYAVAGSICNSEKEAQQLIGPISMLMMLPWFLLVGIITNPDSTLSVAFSLMPVFGPITMYVRTLVSEPPVWHILASIAISITTIAVFFWATSKIFRVGILSYGKRPTIPELWRWLKVA